MELLKEQDRQQATSAPIRSANQETGNGLPVWKRILDLGLILFMLPPILFFGLLLSIIIKSGSTGPVLFRQKRVGYKGKLFTCYKFRTMHVNAETDSHRSYTQQLISGNAPMTKLDGKKDSRVIPLGTLLRATGLDELPQLINVLKGEMSIVGPRPCIPYEYEMYEPWQRRRFDATPGLTGLWQVSGKNRTTFAQMIQFDIEYSQRKSLGLDLGIISRTIPALVAQCQDTRRQRQAKVGKPAAAVSLSKPVSI